MASRPSDSTGRIGPEDPRFQESVSNESVTRGISEDAGKDKESDQLGRPSVNGEKELSEPLSDEEEAESVKFLESLPEEPSEPGQAPWVVDGSGRGSGSGRLSRAYRLSRNCLR